MNSDRDIRASRGTLLHVCVCLIFVCVCSCCFRALWPNKERGHVKPVDYLTTLFPDKPPVSAPELQWESENGRRNVFMAMSRGYITFFSRSTPL